MAWRQAGKEAELEKLSDLCELDMADRRELDDAVLAMLGVASAKRRKEMIDALYRYLREFFERTRQKEEKAILNKNKARRRGKTDPAELAAQIYQELAEEPRGFPPAVRSGFSRQDEAVRHLRDPIGRRSRHPIGICSSPTASASSRGKRHR